MSEHFGKGIPLASGFDLGAKIPLDSRSVVDYDSELQEHITSNRAYAGMRVFVKETKTLYYYDGSSWCIVPSEAYVSQLLANIDLTNFYSKEEIDAKLKDIDIDIDLSDYYTKDELDAKLKNIDLSDYYTKDELEAFVNSIDLSNYYTKSDVDNLINNLETQGGSCSYVGDTVPEDENLIWFSSSNANPNTFTYDNPVIQELFSCIRGLQAQVNQLIEDVEYLKVHGGGSVTPSPSPSPTEECYLQLEDGGILTLEDGALFLLEFVEELQSQVLQLEDGGLLTLEDGGLLVLENSIEVIKDSLLLLENGAQLLLENGGNILSE